MAPTFIQGGREMFFPKNLARTFLAIILCFSFLLGCGGGGSDATAKDFSGSDPNEIPVIVSSSGVRFFIKGENDQTATYLEYSIVRDEEQGQAWRLGAVYEVTRTGEFSFRRLRGGSPIINSGEWETAVKEVGQPDYVGGFHGWQPLSSANFTVDGVDVQLSEDQKIIGENLRFGELSHLLRFGTDEAVAEQTREYSISANGIEISQAVTWLDAVALENSYFAMLPIRRNLLVGSGELITDSGSRDGEQEEDLSVPGFQMVFSNSSVAEVWGSQSGIFASVQIIESPELPNANFHFSNAEEYNKLYFDMSGIYDALPGEEWRIVTDYRIVTTN